MEITAGLRCPTYGGAISGGIGNVNTATVEGYVAGSNVIFIPTQTVISDEGIFKLDSVTISGANVTQNWSGNSNPGFPNPQRVAFSGTLWQILPVSQNSNVGLLVQNSTDFTAITTASRVGYCIYKARVTVGTSGWVTPTIAGFDRSKYLVCCKWNSPYTLDYDGNRLLFLNDGSNTEDQPMIGTVDVIILRVALRPWPRIPDSISITRQASARSQRREGHLFISALILCHPHQRRPSPVADMFRLAALVSGCPASAVVAFITTITGWLCRMAH